MHGRVRSRGELMERVEAVSAEDVRTAFERMLAQRAGIAIAGSVRPGDAERVERLVTAR